MNTAGLRATLGISEEKLAAWLAAGLPHRRVGRRAAI